MQKNASATYGHTQTWRIMYIRKVKKAPKWQIRCAHMHTSTAKMQVNEERFETKWKEALARALTHAQSSGSHRHPNKW